jgi:cytochrome c-type biogenesis protein CcmH/NrfG
MRFDSLRNALDDRRVLLGLGVIMVAAVAAYYLAAAGPGPVEQEAQQQTPTPQPSAQNVAPEVHAQLMTLRRDVEAAPRDTALLFELARMEFDAHQLEQSVATYERLLAVAPDHRQAYLDLAQALLTLGRPDDARRAMERLLEQRPGDLAAMYNLGAIAANAGDLATARTQWAEVAASGDSEMARRATESLAELDRMAAAPSPSAGPLPAGRDGLPPGHPPIPGGFETNVITGPPLPDDASAPPVPGSDPGATPSR